MLKIFAKLYFMITVLFSQNIDDDWDQGSYETRLLSFQVSTFSSGYDIPWGMAFLPSGELLVTDISGSLWLVSKDGGKKRQIGNTLVVYYKGQGGLMDVQVHPDFEQNHLIYLCFSDIQGKNRSHTTVARAVLNDHSLEDFQVIYQVPEQLFTKISRHYGSRIVFDDAGYLYFSIGDRGVRDQAQDITLPNGKIHRIHDDGSIPEDNPFYRQKGAARTIWTYGNRNPQGLAIHPITRNIWEAEHGPRGGDELNIIYKGHNYGWPVITYGINYIGTKITDFTHMEGMDQPVWHWTPSIAVCGIQFYSGDAFQPWQNNLLAASLKFERLHRVVIENGKKVDEEIIFDAGSRVRDVEVGPGGLIYVALEDPGRIVRLSPL
ncbi:uncharacterized protein METZ01_LOCUS86298 [marine metagenome]|uniref:Glucose/Sorbosone dehydrogenase domain-containing protein n=1 Tax=marine metagenome TaxID=408172 RepID=A0A381UZR4_9ZZZZ